MKTDFHEDGNTVRMTVSNGVLGSVSVLVRKLANGRLIGELTGDATVVIGPAITARDQDGNTVVFPGGYSL
jgi:hypothetical protein